MRFRSNLVLATLALTITGPGVALAEAPGPVALSPGETGQTVTSDRRCPTFSWAVAPELAPQVAAFELEVVAEGASQPALLVRLPPGARSFTPSAGRCPAPGRDYVWSIRGLAEEPTRSSEPLRFRLLDRADPEELAWALDVLRRARDLETTPLERRGGVARPSTPARRSAEPVADPRSPPPTDSGRSSVATPTTLPSDASVAGLARVRGIDTGVVEAAGPITALAPLRIGALTLSDADGTVTLWTDNGVAYLSNGPDPAIGVADGWLELDTLTTTEELDVGFRGLSVEKGSWDPGGGTGFQSVPVEFNLSDGYHIKVDDNPSVCPGGSIVVGMRLAETDADQLGIEVRCTRRPVP